MPYVCLVHFGDESHRKRSQRMSDMCLVTGGAGFIGSHLVESLVEHGRRVRVLDDFSTGLRANLAHLDPAPEIVEGDVADAATVERAVQGAGVIFHLAALASVQRSVEAPGDTHRVCATGTLHVLDAARRAGVRRVVYAASSSAYGIPIGDVQIESDPLQPLSPYAAAKLAGELYAQSFTEAFGLETVRLRFFNIFGPRQRADSPYSGVIALFAAALRAGARRPYSAMVFNRAISRSSVMSCKRSCEPPRRRAYPGASTTSVPAKAPAFSISSRRSTVSWAPLSRRGMRPPAPAMYAIRAPTFPRLGAISATNRRSRSRSAWPKRSPGIGSGVEPGRNRSRKAHESIRRPCINEKKMTG